MPRTSEPGRSVSSRLLNVLFAFEPGETEFTLAQLTRKTGLPHATTRRLALELNDVGALEQKPNGHFVIGLRLWRLGTLAPLTESLRTTAQPFMEDLHSTLKQHVQLGVLQGHDAVIVERWSNPGALGLVSQIGGRLPLHCSGLGKVLLGHSSPQLVDEILESELTRYTANTITDPVVLRRELRECCRTGTAVVRGELTPGADSFASRIIDGNGRVVAALSVVVSSGSVEPHMMLPLLMTSGLGISRSLGWRPGVRVKEG